MLALDRPVVFPLFAITSDGKCSCGVDACGRVGKHPAVNWGDVVYGSAVPRPEPGAGAGLKTGAAPHGSGVFVVDLDSDAAGELFDAMGPCPETLTVKTPRGRHLYFNVPEHHVRNSASDLGKGIDVRGDGGFVVAPGSPHRSGGTYEIEIAAPVADAPAWLLTWLQSRPAPVAAQHYPGDLEPGSAEHAYHRTIYAEYLKSEAPARGPERRGQGDQILFNVVQRGAYDLALPVDDVLELVAEHYDPRCSPPWGDELEERVHHKAHDAKTNSARPRAEPLPEDLAHLATSTPAPPASGVQLATSASEVTKAKRITAAQRAMKVGGKGLRLTTGLPSVDVATRGGLLLRKVLAVGGAPGAGKTALVVQLAFRWLMAGIWVAFFAADEDADALLIRFGQLAGLSRDALESGDAVERTKLAAWCESVPFLLIDGDEDETLEQTSRDLRAAAGNSPSALIVDSIQTARTAEAVPNGSDLRARVNVVVRALKNAAKVDGHLVVATSEISKAAYRNKAQAENVSPLSAFKESGDIEYGVSLAIVLTSRQGSSELVDAVVAKNRLGPGKPELMLMLDHARAAVTETSANDAKATDPLYFLKCEIIDVVTNSFGMRRTAIYTKIGGKKATVIRAINELLDARRLFEDPRGLRLPLPGDPGYVAA